MSLQNRYFVLEPAAENGHGRACMVRMEDRREFA